MKKKEYAYDYKFDWIIRKQKHSLGLTNDDYKRKLIEKLEIDKYDRKHKKKDEEDEEMKEA